MHHIMSCDYDSLFDQTAKRQDILTQVGQNGSVHIVEHYFEFGLTCGCRSLKYLYLINNCIKHSNRGLTIMLFECGRSEVM